MCLLEPRWAGNFTLAPPSLGFTEHWPNNKNISDEKKKASSTSNINQRKNDFLICLSAFVCWQFSRFSRLLLNRQRIKYNRVKPKLTIGDLTANVSSARPFFLGGPCWKEPWLTFDTSSLRQHVHSCRKRFNDLSPNFGTRSKNAGTVLQL